jgi:hypothetical protein
MTMGRWNEEARRYEPFSPGAREYGALPGQLRSELERVPPVSDGLVNYYPCKVRLKDGRWQDFVYVVDADSYIRVWGVWPDQDKGKRAIMIEDVEEIAESPSRLPPAFAQRLYEAGESGMGYVIFELSYSDGSRSAHSAGNAVDFVRLPNDKTPKDIVGVHPHAGREARDHFSVQQYYWCLFGKK